MTSDSRAREIANYSFLVMFANDGLIDAAELAFVERLALADREIDAAEREVLRNIFGRVKPERLAPDVAAEIARFRAAWDI